MSETGASKPKASEGQVADLDMRLLTGDFSKQFSQAPAKVYAEMMSSILETGARSLERQANFFKSLSKCEELADIMKCNSDFLQQLWKDTMDGSAKVQEKLQESYAASTSEQN